MSDVISNPAHYTDGRKYEPRKVIEDWDLDFYLGNALKYIARAGRKDNAIEDLNKAKQYLDFEIEKLEKDSNTEDTFDGVTLDDVMGNAEVGSMEYYNLGGFITLPYTKSNSITSTEEDDKNNSNIKHANLVIDMNKGECMLEYIFDYALKDIDIAIQRCRALPDSREKSVSITKLEEAQMWVRKARDNDKSHDSSSHI